jgi:hypothetical protein
MGGGADQIAKAEVARVPSLKYAAAGWELSLPFTGLGFEDGNSESGFGIYLCMVSGSTTTRKRRESLKLKSNACIPSTENADTNHPFRRIR